jgi:hypothetical protein
MACFGKLAIQKFVPPTAEPFAWRPERGAPGTETRGTDTHPFLFSGLSTGSYIDSCSH